jgi:ADP-dependent NAD(P)H-hydrate dehydratase / NAD(P)H-hydrate epimerase
MCLGVGTAQDAEPLIQRSTVIAVGPGLGRDDWARALFDRALSAGRPLVIDADGLNLLAEHPQRRPSWVLTPHPGEAARLLGNSARQIQSDRRAAAEELCARYGGIGLLKGRCTLVGEAGELPFVIDAGNPGMASAGMGDVLTGLVAGVIAQVSEVDRLHATACAAYVHARAADEAARKGERGLIATDLFATLRGWLNPVR